MSEANRDLLRTFMRDFVPWLAVILIAMGWVWSDSAAMATITTTQADHERRLTAAEMAFSDQAQELSDIKAQISALSVQIADLRRLIMAAGHPSAFTALGTPAPAMAPSVPSAGSGP
ncbi:MAG: hypothetical protein M0002_13730 [Rhodospirillales bacterium]|nr:hypothetical protein [Rhodospirillales bacterium]